MINTPIQLQPINHAMMMVDRKLVGITRTCKPYGQEMLPTELSVGSCQHPGIKGWNVTFVDMVGLIVHDGVVTTQPVTARFDPDDPGEKAEMPPWLSPLLDQIMADLDARVVVVA